MNKALKEHWNQQYAGTPLSQLGWYEPQSMPSVRLIENCAVPRHSPIADVGSGASTLIADLLQLGYHNLFAIDISDVALEKAKALLSKDLAARVHWMADDITHPASMLKLQNIAVWHDRAVFHFLTAEKDRQTYLSLAQKTLMPGGFMVIAAFSPQAADHCSGLPVQRYSLDSLCEFFRDGFKLVESLSYIYTMPSGSLRPYVCARFQKNQAG